MPPTKDLFASSSDDDDNELDRQLATANARERRRDPHAFAEFGKQKKEKARGDAEGTSDSSSGEEEEEERMVTSAAQKAKRGDVVKTTNEKGGIRINKQYAAKYEEVKRQKELRQLTEKYGNRLSLKSPSGGNDDPNNDEDEEEEEDDNAVLLTEHKELAFAKAFLAIRSAGSGAGELHKESEQLPKFFPSAEDQLAENNAVFTRAMAQKEAERRRRFTLADEYRRGMTNSSAAGEGERESEQHPQGDRKIKPQSAKERQLRETFLKNITESTETFDVQPVPDSNNNNNNNNSGEHATMGKSSAVKDILAEAFSIRGKKKSGKRQNSALKGESDDHNGEGADVEEEPQTEGNDDDANEAFICDYFVNELWKPGKSKGKKQKQGRTKDEEEDVEEEEEEEENETGNNYAMLAQLAREEEDERFYADAEAWEREYQDRAYRHQDEAAEHIQSFPRPIGEHAAGLLRRSAGVSGRKEARQRRLQRMEEMQQRQVEELKRLKTLKRQEIEEQRALIAAVAGLSEATKGSGKPKKSNDKKKNNKDAPLGENEEAIKRVMALWSEKDLDEDFDPKEFDKKMAKLFDDEYYDEKNVDDDEIAFFHEELDAEDDENEPGEDDDGDDEEGAVDSVPDLYNANSLEDAIEMGASTNVDSARTQKNRTSANDRDAAVSDPMLSDDPLALLYPSAALRVAEEADFRHVTQRLRSTHGNDDERGAEKLAQLRADLKAREKEYWELHHDSTLDGGAVKTRFQYREVPAEDFLLPVEEILARDDRQLNMIVPMSCYAAYLDKNANARDRERVTRRTRRGFRELDSSRRSRRYGEVAKTALVDMQMSETAGQEWAERVRDGLRRSREEDGLNDTETRGAPQVKRERKEFRGERGSRGTGRGGMHAQRADRTKPHQREDNGARQGGRGGRGRGRGRGGGR